MRFKAACVQFAPKKAEIEDNLSSIARHAQTAVAQGASLVVFPETSTSGYFLEGGVYESSLRPDELAERLAAKIGALSEPLDLVVGFYERADEDLFNSVAYITFEDGQATVRQVYRKFFLPTYGVFDEERFVSRGRELGVVETRFGKVGLLICEDVWHSIMPTLTVLAGATILVVPSASPARGFEGDKPGNLARYEDLLLAISREHSVFCLNSMLCGFEGGKGFVGGSIAVDPMGHFLNRGPLLEEHMMLVDIDTDLVHIARSQSPLLGDLRAAWSDLASLAKDL
ncbi:MAG: beta-ureidopropionase [Armatimonadetes bacterium]|nr:beta-ureidopropionase [Armatimonadota bacterium]